MLAMPTYTGVRVNAASKDHPQLVIITIDLYGLLPPRLLPVQYVDLHVATFTKSLLKCRAYGYGCILTLF